MAIDPQRLVSALRMMPDQQLQQTAQMHFKDPYIFPPVFQESQRRQTLRSGIQSDDKSGDNPLPVNQQALMAMAPQQPVPPPTQTAAGGGYMRSRLPENVGIGGLPMQSNTYAGGGIVAFAGGGRSSVGSYEEQIRAEAVRQGVDPDLMVRMFATESEGNPKAVSPKGAAGLGQLMIPAAAEMGLSPEDRFNPSKNIPASVGYFKKQLGAFGGDQEKAAAAYNWGPGAMRKHLASNPKDWKLGLPKETANYLTKLMPVGTAQAQTAPPTAAPETAKPSAGGLSALLASLGGAAAGAREALTPSFKPGTTLGRAVGRTAATAGPLAALGAVGGGLTAGATNALSNATPEQLEMLQNSGGGDDTSLAAAIMNPANRGPEVTAKQMPYGEQMGNVIQAFVGHPDVYKKTAATPEEVAPGTAGSQGPVSGAAWGEGAPPADITPKEAIAAAKSTMTPEERKESGFSAEDWLTLGFALLSGKSPFALQNLGEAGAAMLAGKTARTKAGLEALKTKQEIELSKAHQKYYGSAAERMEEENKPLAQMRKELAAIDAELQKNMMLGMDPLELARVKKERYAAIAQRYPDLAGTMGLGTATGVVVPQGVTVTRTG